MGRAYFIVSVIGNRYCLNIGREHRSNGIFFSIDLKAQTFKQLCHDPNCNRFRSPAVTLNPSFFQRSIVNQNFQEMTISPVGSSNCNREFDTELCNDDLVNGIERTKIPHMVPIQTQRSRLSKDNEGSNRFRGQIMRAPA